MNTKNSSTSFLKKILRAKRNQSNVACVPNGMCLEEEDLWHEVNKYGQPFLDYGKLPVQLRHLGNLWLLFRSKSAAENFDRSSRIFVHFQMVHFELLDSLLELKVIDHIAYEIELTSTWGLFVSYCGALDKMITRFQGQTYVRTDCSDELYFPLFQKKSAQH